MIEKDLGDSYEYIRQVFVSTVRALVDDKDAVTVEIFQELKTVKVRVAPKDLPLLIDNGMRTIRSLRSILIAATKSRLQEPYVMDLKPHGWAGDSATHSPPAHTRTKTSSPRI